MSFVTVTILRSGGRDDSSSELTLAQPSSCKSVSQTSLIIHESFALSQMFTQLVAESHNVQKNTYACTVKNPLSYIPYPYGIVRLASFLNPLSLKLSGQPASQTLSSLSPCSPSRPVPSQPIGQRTLPFPLGRLLVIWALPLRPGRMTSARPGLFLFLFFFEGDDRRIRVGLQDGVRIHLTVNGKPTGYKPVSSRNS